MFLIPGLLKGTNTYEQAFTETPVMTEIGLAEYFNMEEALGIIGTLFVVLYFSRKQTQSLSIDIETKVLNDLAERLDSLVHIDCHIDAKL